MVSSFYYFSDASSISKGKRMGKYIAYIIYFMEVEDKLGTTLGIGSTLFAAVLGSKFNNLH